MSNWILCLVFCFAAAACRHPAAARSNLMGGPRYSFSFVTKREAEKSRYFRGARLAAHNERRHPAELARSCASKPHWGFDCFATAQSRLKGNGSDCCAARAALRAVSLKNPRADGLAPARGQHSTVGRFAISIICCNFLVVRRGRRCGVAQRSMPQWGIEPHERASFAGWRPSFWPPSANAPRDFVRLQCRLLDDIYVSS